MADTGAEDAIDLSSLYLTWATAIMTRLFYESLKMTVAAVSFSADSSAWYKQLSEYMSPLFGNCDFDDEQVDLIDDVESSDAIRGNNEKRRVRNVKRLSIWKRTCGGRLDRKILIFAAALDIIFELANMILNLSTLLSSLHSQESTSIFAKEGEENQQCSANNSDAPRK